MLVVVCVPSRVRDRETVCFQFSHTPHPTSHIALSAPGGLAGKRGLYKHCDDHDRPKRLWLPGAGLPSQRVMATKPSAAAALATAL